VSEPAADRRLITGLTVRKTRSLSGHDFGAGASGAGRKPSRRATLPLMECWFYCRLKQELRAEMHDTRCGWIRFERFCRQGTPAT
jgi:hypothetical protein